LKAQVFDCSNRLLCDRYDRLFEACSKAFIQQSRYWAEVIQDLGPDQAIFLLCEDEGRDIAALPLYLYKHRLGSILGSVPQAGPMGGVFFREDLDENRIADLYRCLIDAALELARSHHCLTLSLISNPFTDDLPYYERYLLPTYVLENFTQYIPLKESHRRSHGHRNNLNKAKKSVYQIRFCEEDKSLEEWIELHQKSHTALGAEPLNQRLLENIVYVLGARKKMGLLLVYAQDKIVSGGLYIYHRNVMDVFMLSLTRETIRPSPNFLNTEASISWAKDMGIEIYNWQSSPSRESGVYAYKKQWGSLEKDYYFVTKLLCVPERIQEMGLQTMKTAYSQHYVLPYAVFTQGFQNKYFKKG